MRYEYIAVSAPTRGEKVKDAKTPTDRYARAVTVELNRMAAEGWDYVRAEILPSEERSGLAGRSTVYHNLLIFRKEIATRARDKPAALANADAPAAASPTMAMPADTTDSAAEPAAGRRDDQPDGNPATAGQPASDQTSDKGGGGA